MIQVHRFDHESRALIAMLEDNDFEGPVVDAVAERLDQMYEQGYLAGYAEGTAVGRCYGYAEVP